MKRQRRAAAVGLGASGIQFRVTKNGHQFTITSGVARIGEDAPVPADGRFRISCVTKLFVSTVLVNVLLPVVHPLMGTPESAANDCASCAGDIYTPSYT